MGGAHGLWAVNAAWVMDILPDETSTSAIWAVQRLEAGHAPAPLEVIVRPNSETETTVTSSQRPCARISPSKASSAASI